MAALTMERLGKVDVLSLAEPDRPVARLAGHAAEVVALAFHPDGRRLATSSSDGTTRIWDSAAEKCAWFMTIDFLARFSSDGTRCDFRRRRFSANRTHSLRDRDAPFYGAMATGAPTPDEPARKIPVRATFSPMDIGWRWALLTERVSWRYRVGGPLCSLKQRSLRCPASRRWPAPFHRRRVRARHLDSCVAASARPDRDAERHRRRCEECSTGGGVRQLTLDADGQPLALLRGMQASYRSYSRNRWLPIPVADRAES